MKLNRVLSVATVHRIQCGECVTKAATHRIQNEECSTDINEEVL